MDLSFSSADEAFRAQVRDFLAGALSEDLKRTARRMTSVYADKRVALEWQAILHARGWAAPSWPVEYGGCDWTVSQRYIFDVELARASAPPLSPMGIGMCGPVLIGHGTEAQKAHFLPRILSGEHFWCQGYSETGAGSDLAQLQMKAVDDGDSFVCTGHKIWTTHAHEANWMFCLVRTDGTGRPQQGITFLLTDMESPGVRVEPIIMLSGEHIQNIVHFDEVRVPKDNVVGAIGAGWGVAKYLLEFERGGTAYGPKLLARLAGLRGAAAELEALSPAFNARLARAEVECSALEAAELHLMSDLSRGGTPGVKASMMKVRGTELSQHLTELALDIAGHYAHPFQPAHTAPGGPVRGVVLSNDTPIGPDIGLTAAAKYLNDRAGSIYAGSNEIQRNILAKAALGL